MGKYLPCPEPVNVRTEVLPDCVHALSADFFAQLLYLISKLIVIVEHLARGVDLHAFKSLRAALSISLKLRYTVYLVAPELDTDRLIRLNGVYVEDRTAY